MSRRLTGKSVFIDPAASLQPAYPAANLSRIGGNRAGNLTSLRL
jgi:hypothetical protein